jgi:hypothetical protein
MAIRLHELDGPVEAHIFWVYLYGLYPFLLYDVTYQTSQ